MCTLIYKVCSIFFTIYFTGGSKTTTSNFVLLVPTVIIFSGIFWLYHELGINEPSCTLWTQCPYEATKYGWSLVKNHFEDLMHECYAFLTFTVGLCDFSAWWLIKNNLFWLYKLLCFVNAIKVLNFGYLILFIEIVEQCGKKLQDLHYQIKKYFYKCKIRHIVSK